MNFKPTDVNYDNETVAVNEAKEFTRQAYP